MAVTKSDVERYIKNVERHLTSAHERNLKGLGVAAMCRRANEPQLAKRYVLAYMSVNAMDYRGHKLLGELLEDSQEYHDALETYKRCFVLNGDQNDVLLKIVQLHTELKIDPEIAKAWADMASKQMPGHPAIFDLQVHVIEMCEPINYDKLIHLVADELTHRPRDSAVHTKLVETYIETDQLEEAFYHVVSVNKTKAFNSNLSWFVLTVDVLERYLGRKELKVKNDPPDSRQNVLQEIYVVMLCSYCNLVELNLKEARIRNSSRALLRLDQLLYQAVNLDNGLNNSTDLSDASEWDVAITEIRAQLYMLSGHLLLRLAKEGYSTWCKSLDMATACYVTSLCVSEPETSCPWAAKASSNRSPFTWTIMAAARLSQTGHLILATVDRYGEDKIGSILLNWCSSQGQEDILTTLYGHDHDASKLFLSEDESFLTPEFEIPGDLIKYDEVFIAENPGNLQLIVWIGLHWYQHDQHVKPGVGVLAGRIFKGLRMDVRDIRQCAADTISLRDIEAFVYAVVKCSAQSILDDVDVVYEFYQPKLSPICLSVPLCIDSQYEWWQAAYALYSGSVSISDSGKVKWTVQRGLEQIRALKNHGMHPRLVTYLATNFGQKSLTLKDAAGFEHWYYSEHWKSLQLRSLHYWNIALCLFEDMKRNKNPGIPKNPLFPHNLSHLEEPDVHRYFREACMVLGEAAVERGDLEQALNLFNRVETSHAAWNEAQIFKYLAGLESNGADVDDRAYDSYMHYLKEAKDRLLICLERLEYAKVVRDAVEEELAILESLLQERKSFYHVDPRKSIDFHQLDFDALKSPVCSDNTDSGEPASLKENDTRELLATVSEVTLDNGFLREQVSIRDEQVLRLSRQVQELQNELSRHETDGDGSLVKISFSTKSPTIAFHDSQAPKTSQLGVEDQFTRQSTFVNNAVVPADGCNDPSFFSGLSMSNTPETSPTKPVKENEVDSNEEDDIYFEPIVQLPETTVEFKSGEEDEDVVFEERAKLFRFGSATKEWKERGTGNIKLLFNPKSGRARILMRREKVYKVCANHFVTPDMALKPGKGSTKSWVWSTLADSSDEEIKAEQFAAKFETEEIAKAFKVKFEEVQLKKPVSSALSPSINVKYNTNTPPFITGNLPYLSSTPSNSNPFTSRRSKVTFDVISPQSSPTAPNKFTFSTGTSANPNVAKQPLDENLPHAFPSQAEAFSRPFEAAPISTQRSFFQENEYQKSSKPFQFPQFSALENSGAISVQPKVQPGLFQPQTTDRMSTFSFTFPGKQELSSRSTLKTENTRETSAVNDGNRDEKISQNDVAALFGIPSKGNNLSFQELASHADETFEKSSSVNRKEFTGIERQRLFIPDNEGEDNEEPINEENIAFEPIVSLPLVDNQRTGEEEETIRFCNRAKLFRFDTKTKEWKERGIGEIKLLHNPRSGKSRVVMRREQVHKICANHVIIPSMKLKTNKTSDRSWLWHTSADISDGEPNAEQLAVRFKLQETALEFKKVFEGLQSITAMPKDFQEGIGSSGFAFGSQKPKEDTDSSGFGSLKPKEETGSSGFAFDSLKPKEDTGSSGFAFDSLKPKEDTGSSGFAFDSLKPKEETSSSGFAFGSLKPKEDTSSSGFGYLKPKEDTGSSGFAFGSQKPKEGTGSSGFAFGSLKPKEDTGSSGFGSLKPKEDTCSSGFAFGSLKPKEDTGSSGFAKSAKSVQPNKEPVPIGFSFPGAGVVGKTTTDPSKLIFQPTEGSWECDTCLVRNTDQTVQCVACETLKPGTEASSTQANVPLSSKPMFSFKTNSPASTNFTFGSPLANKDSDKSVQPNKEPVPTGFSFPVTGAKGNTTTTPSKSIFQPVEGSWECDTCLVRNTDQTVQCVACETPKPGTEASSTEANAFLSSKPMFFFKTNSPASTNFTFGSPLANKDSDKSVQPNKEPVPTGFSFPVTGAKGNTTTTPSKLIFQPTEGSWECDTCLVRNTYQTVQCVACETLKPGTEASSTQANVPLSSKPMFSFKTNSPASTNFTFGFPLPSPDSAKSVQPNKESVPTGFSFPGAGVVGKTTTDTSKLIFQPTEGSWECDTCLVRNTEEAVQCVSCETPKPGTEASSTQAKVPLSSKPMFSFKTNSPASTNFTFGSPLANKDSDKFVQPNKEPVPTGFSFPVTGAKGNTTTTPSKSIFQPVEGSWECDTCLVRNTDQTVQCVACETPKPGTAASSTEANVSLSSKPMFSFKTNSPASTNFTFGSPLPSQDSAKSVQPNKEPVPTGFSIPGAGVVGKTTTDPSKLIFQPTEGSWECDTCLVRNTDQTVQCVACETPKPGTAASSTEANVSLSSKPMFSFKTNSPASTNFTFGSPPPSQDSAKSVQPNKEPVPTGFSLPGAGVNDKTTATPLPAFTFGFSPPDNEKPHVVTSESPSTEKSAFVFGAAAPNKESKTGFTFASQHPSDKTAESDVDGASLSRGKGLGARVPGNEPKEIGFTLLSSKTESISLFKPLPDSGSHAPIEECGETVPSPKIDKNAATSPGDLKLKFQPGKGTWECNVCLIRHTEEALHCVACQTPNLSAVTSQHLNTTSESKPAFSFNTKFPSSQDQPESKKESGFTFSNIASEAGRSDKTGFVFGLPRQNQQSAFGNQPSVVNLTEHGEFKFRLDLPRETTVSTSIKSAVLSSGEQVNDEQENPEKEDRDLAFTPIVSLPTKVDLKNGEEDEIVKFCNRAKLYRFHEETWKERGVGEIKILHDVVRKRSRVVMRRDQVHILCANHFISREMVLKPHGDSQNCWIWHATGDIAENEVKGQLFAVKFKDSEIANVFKDAFEDAVCIEGSALVESSQSNDEDVELIREICASQDQHHRAAKLLLPANFYVHEKQVTTDALDAVKSSTAVPQSFVFGSPNISSLSFGALAGDITSKSGFTKSPQDKGFLGVSGQLFGEDKKNDDEYDPENEASGVHFQPIVQLPDKIEHSTGEENEEVIYCERAKLYRFDKDVGQWKERGVGNLKLLKHKTNGQVRVLMRRDQVFKLCANHFLTADMELKPNAGSDRSWAWHTSGDVSDGETKAEQLAARFRNAEMAKTFKEKFELCKGLLGSIPSGREDERTDSVEAEREETNDKRASFEPAEAAPVFLFGSKQTTSLSFASLASQTCGFAKDNQTEKEFVGFGRKLFGQPSTEEGEEGYDPEKEVGGGDFKPVVSLKAIVDQQTGEEDENVIYSHRAKLYRYDQELKQWKERGVGKIKILVNTETNQSRVVMRREQIHKLCANHFITREMELKENAGSDRSWVWSVIADFADGIAKSELLAVRFKHREDAVKFRDHFLECKEKLPSPSANQVSHVKKSEDLSVNKDEDSTKENDDDVVITYEKIPSAEQKELAHRYLLPENFYLFKQNRKINSGESTVPQPSLNETAKSTFDASKHIQEPSSGATSSFMFGSPEITTLSFDTIASTLNTKSGYNFNNPLQDKGFVGAAGQLFGGGEDGQNDDEYDPESETSRVHFQPIVQLPDKVEHSTGEENEEVIYCERAKLYRFDKDVGQWKERGVGNLKLLKHKTNGQVRVLMRRDQVYKLCANHFLTADMELKPNAGSDRSWAWHTSGDVSDGEAKAEQLAARFKNAEIAKAFKEKIELCKEELAETVATALEDEGERIEAAGGENTESERTVGEPAAVPTPIFQFGSKHTASLSFASLASQTCGFAKDNKTEKEFVGFGRKLFGQPSTEEGEEGYDPEKEVGGGDFKPVVSLKAIVDHQTGEEDENVIYSHRAKLYRYDQELKQWKERGVGKIKILVNAETNQCRVVMRREQIHKLCANHFITREMELKENAGSDRSWGWYVNADFADGIAKSELLAVRFRHHEDAVKFQEKFRECQETLGEPEDDESGRLEKVTHVDNNTERKEAEDDNVEVTSEEVVECHEKLQEQKEDKMSHTENAELSAYSMVTKEVQAEQDVNDVSKDTLVTSKEDKNDGHDDVVITYEKIPSVQEKERASRYGLPETFYTVSERRSSPKTKDASKSVEASAVPTPIFQFGSKHTASLSFSSLASQTCGFAKDNKSEKEFVGFGRKLFGQPSTEEGEDDYDPEKEVGGGDFKPVVSLPTTVDLQTGEEDENVIYSHRAKLYRYDQELKQWKERGVGKIKILVNAETNQCRVVMRREQIHKLCANHFITREMELKENAGSDRSWVWSVNADFADGIAKSEFLAVRFRHREDAVKFQEKFRECQEKLGEPEDDESGRLEKVTHVDNNTERKEAEDDNVEVTSEEVVECHEKLQEPKEDKMSHTENAELSACSMVTKEDEAEQDVNDVSKDTLVTNEEDENDTHDDVVITYEKIPSVQEKERASRYSLPETFYTVSEERRSSPKTKDASKSVEASAVPTPIFQFGSKHTESLSFASLASQTCGFAKDNETEKEFAGFRRKLFGQPSTEEGEDDYDPQIEVGGGDFKPVVSLPTIVHQQTGEEDENVIYSHRAKLYRYDQELKQWKERGVGKIKILVNAGTNQCRVVMRREQIHKLCANHFITREMELKENAGSDRSWVWCVNADFADGIAKSELLAVRFKHREDAEKFQEKFRECQEKLAEPKVAEGKEAEDDNVEETKLRETKVEKATIVDIVAERNEAEDDNVEETHEEFVECHKKLREPKENEGDRVEKATIVDIVAERNEAEDDNVEETHEEFVECHKKLREPKENEGDRFEKATPVDNVAEKKEAEDDDVVLTREEVVDCHEKLQEPKKDEPNEDVSGKFELATPVVNFTESNEAETDNDDNVEVTYQKIPSVEERDLAQRYEFPVNFYVKDEDRNQESDENPAHSTFTTIPKSESNTSTETLGPSFIFGSQDISSLSFDVLVSGLTNSMKNVAKSPQDKGFLNGAGGQLFGEDEENGDEYDSENESSRVHFQPIVQLPDKVEHSTGEENEEVIYCERAKLYRFDKDVSQWKERGVGNLKLLKHKTNGQVRVLMRRDQVFKLCANHLLTADMELKPNAGSDRSWVWHTSGDVSDGETKAEQLAARFKNAEIAKTFKEKFELCKECLFSSTSEVVKQPNENTNTADEDTDDDKESENITEVDSERKVCSNEKNESQKSSFEYHVTTNLKQPEEKLYTSPEKEKKSSSFPNDIVLNIQQQQTLDSKELWPPSPIVSNSPGQHKVSRVIEIYEAGQVREKIETHSVFHVSTFEVFSYEKKELELGDSESVFFKQDAKMYYFNKAQDKWLEKAFGALQIIGRQNRFHIFMSDKHSSSVCVAHKITPDMDLKPNTSSDRSWVWCTLEDHSTEPEKPEEFSAEFLSVESSLEFKRKFEECRDLCGVPHEGNVRAMAASFNANSREIPSVDIVARRNLAAGTAGLPMWSTCSNCHVDNNVRSKKCLVCGEELPGVRSSKTRTKSKTKADNTICEKEMKTKLPTPCPSKVVVSHATNYMVKKKTLVVIEWWKCLNCSVQNNASNTHCTICSCPKVLVETEGAPSSEGPQVDSSYPFSTPDSGKMFGSLMSSPKSFADLASSPSGFQLPTITPCFSGSPVFGETSLSVSKPVTLPFVGKSDVEAEDEKDECVFAQHVKLLRFDSSAAEWREKGTGTLKILRNIGTQRTRIVMHRDKILSLCANHNITPEMELIAPDDTDKAWMWTALDYSYNEETSVEQLSAVFKTSALAADFKEVFDNCRASACQSSTSGSQTPSIRYYEGFPTCSPEVSEMLSEVMKK